METFAFSADLETDSDNDGDLSEDHDPIEDVSPRYVFPGALAQVQLSVTATAASHDVIVYLEEYSEYLRVWADSAKTTEINVRDSSELDFDQWGVDGYPNSVWVEVLDPMSTGNLELSLVVAFDRLGCTGIELARDRVIFQYAPVDLDIQLPCSVLDEDDDDPPGMVKLNSDDDDADGFADKDDFDGVSGEQDLQPLALPGASGPAAAITSGVYKLDYDEFKVMVWWTPTKDLATDVFPDAPNPAAHIDSLYVEGRTVGEHTITLRFEYLDGTSSEGDTITVVVVDPAVDIATDLDGDGDIDEDDNSGEDASSRLVPTGTLAEVRLSAPSAPASEPLMVYLKGVSNFFQVWLDSAKTTLVELFDGPGDAEFDSWALGDVPSTISVEVLPTTPVELALTLAYDDQNCGVQELASDVIRLNRPVTITDLKVEWQGEGDDWTVAGEEEWLGVDDILRWSVATSPTEPDIHLDYVTWYKKPWDQKDDPSVSWADYSTASCTGPECFTPGHPGVGEWAVSPFVSFTDAYTGLSGFVAEGAAVRKAREAAIVGIQWRPFPLWNNDTHQDEDNLIHDNSEDMGGGWRFFGGRNSSTGPIHENVYIRVMVQPNVSDIPVYLKLLDADDPTDHDGPIDSELEYAAIKITDNIEDIPWETEEVITFAALAGPAFADHCWTTTLNPGDNFRVAAAVRPHLLDRTKPIHYVPDGQEAQGRAFFDRNDNDQREADEPIIPVPSGTGARLGLSELLTIWRKVYVEVDSMGAPDDDPFAPYLFDPTLPVDDPNPEDWASFSADIPDPPTYLLGPAFRKAFIEITILPEAPASGATPDRPSQSNLPFQQYFSGDSFTDYVFNGPDSSRQTKNEDNDWWTVYVLGGYERYGDLALGETRRDNDMNQPDQGLGSAGFNQYPGATLIPYEIIDDIGRQHSWSSEQAWKVAALAVLHEVGHQFALEHDDLSDDFGSHIMVPPYTEEDEAVLYEALPEFREFDIREIREWGSAWIETT